MYKVDHKNSFICFHLTGECNFKESGQQDGAPRHKNRIYRPNR